MPGTPRKYPREGRCKNKYLIDKVLTQAHHSISLKAQLSKKALENLLLHCPQIRKVNMSAWNISREDFEKILQKLDHDNLNITLIGPK